MRYVAKITDRFNTNYGYGATDDEAVRDAVANRAVATGGTGSIDYNSAWLTVRVENDNGEVEPRYGMSYVAYQHETR